MIKKLLILALVTPIVVSAAWYNPFSWFQENNVILSGAGDKTIVPTVLPKTDSSWDIGTSTNAFRQGWFDELCLTGDTCKTAWPSGGGGGDFPFTVNTGYNSTSTVIGFNGLFSTASSTFSSNVYFPSLTQGFAYIGSGGKLNTVSTSTALADYVPTSRTLTINGVAYDLSDNRNWTVIGAGSGLASATPWTLGSLVVAKNDGSVTTISTSTLKTSELTNDAGFLTSAENPLTFLWPLIRTTNTISFGGLSTTTNLTTGHIPFVSGANTFSSRATTSASCSGSVSCSSFDVLGSSPVTISGTDNTASTTLLGDTNSWTGVNRFGYASSTYMSFGTASTTNLNIGGDSFIDLTGTGLAVSGGVLNTSNIPNASLQNSSITINGSAVSLGGSLTVASTTLLGDTNYFSGVNRFNYASTTYHSFTTASTTNLRLGLADGCLNITSGLVGSTGSACGAGGSGGADFTYATDIGYGITGSATTTKTQFTLGLHASSTSHFSNATSTLFTAVTGWFTNIFVGVDTLAEYIADTAGAMFTGNTETGVTVTYQDADNTVDVVCDTANGSTFGCLSSTDWTTFNNKQATISATWPITLSGATLGFDGIATSSAPTIGNVAYWTGVNRLGTVATTSATCSGGISCTSFNVFGSSPVTISSFTYPFPSAATSTTLTLSGGFNASGGTATLGTVAGAIDAGGATSLEIPNGTAPTIDAVGEIALDTSDNMLIVGTSTNSMVVGLPLKQKLWSGTIASTSLDFASGGRIPLNSWSDGVIITEIQCFVDGGTSKAINIDTLAGGANTDSVTCATTNTKDTAMSANYIIAAETPMAIEFGATSGSVDYVSFSVWGFITRE